jgi:hypothetical protein
MAAQPASSTLVRPKVWIESERRTSRSDDPERALQLQLDAVLASHDLDLLVVADCDGTPIEMSGDPDLGMELADFAAAVFKKSGDAQTLVTSRGFVVVAPVQTALKTYVIAAQGRWSVPDMAGFARALAGVERILRAGVFVRCAVAMPLVRRS